MDGSTWRTERQITERQGNVVKAQRMTAGEKRVLM